RMMKTDERAPSESSLAERPSPGTSASPKGLARGVLAAGVVLVSALVVATELQPDPSIAEALDDAHWTLAYATASLLAYLGYRGADPASRQARGFFTLAALAMTLGQLVWFVQLWAGGVSFPGPSDAAFVSAGVFVFVGPGTRIGRLPSPERAAYALDALGLTLAALTSTLALYLPLGGNFGALGGVMLASYPTLYLGAAGMALVLLLARRARIRASHVVMIGSLVTLGFCWMVWNLWFLSDALRQGVLLNYAFSYSMLAFGYAASEWSVEGPPDASLERRYYLVSGSIPLALVLVAAFAMVFAQQLDLTSFMAARGCVVLVALVAVVRQSLLLRERERALAAE